MSGSYYYYLALAVVLLAIGILSHQKGFWPTYVRSWGTLLAALTALGLTIPLSERIGSMGGYGQIVSLVGVFVVTLAVLMFLVSRGPKTKNFFEKRANLIATGIFLLFVAVGGYFAIGKLAATPAADTSPPVPAAGVATDPPPTAESTGWHLNPSVAETFAPSVVVLIVICLGFVCWSATGSWIHNDARRLEFRSAWVWNLLSVLAFPLGIVGAILIQNIAVGVILPALLFLVPSLIYVILRNKKVASEEKVLTPAHLTKVLLGLFAPKKRRCHDKSGWAFPMEILGAGKQVPRSERTQRSESLKKHPGGPLLCELIYHAVKNRATAIRLDSSDGTLSMIYQLDGYWQPMKEVFKRPISSDDHAMLFEALRVVLGGNPADARGRISGSLGLEYDRKKGKAKKMAASAVLQGKEGGSEALVQFELLALRIDTLEKLGMAPDRAEQVAKLLNADTGLILFSTPPGHGLKTLVDVALTVADRFTRDFVSVEDVNKPSRTIENVQQVTYDSRQGQAPKTVLPDVMFREPRVVILRDFCDAESLSLCCQEAKNRLIILTLRAKDSVDAILRFLQTGVEAKQLAEALTVVVSQRLVRRLCPMCKEDVPANPEILRRLGIPTDFAPILWRKRVPPTGEPPTKRDYLPCPECLEVGYKTRMGIYDIITVTDELRQAIVTDPTEETIRAAAAKSHERGFLPEGANMVAWGATSFDELVQSLK